MLTIFTLPFMFSSALVEKGGFFKVLAWIIDVAYGAALILLFQWLFGLFCGKTLTNILTYGLLFIIVLRGFLFSSGGRRGQGGDQ